jgi:hypothetical protein
LKTILAAKVKLDGPIQIDPLSAVQHFPRGNTIEITMRVFDHTTGTVELSHFTAQGPTGTITALNPTKADLELAKAMAKLLLVNIDGEEESAWPMMELEN